MPIPSTDPADMWQTSGEQFKDTTKPALMLAEYWMALLE